jgi:RNA ligase
MVIVKPFSKFFNYEEVPNEVPWTTSEYVYIQEKMDGSLGILFNYKGEWILSTRGSFTSEQAIRGMQILQAKYDLTEFEPSIAYICEIIYPENRIVVNYNEEKIVFLGVVANESYGGWVKTEETELNWATANAYFKMSGIEAEDIVPTKQIFSKDMGHELYKELKALNEKNKEGYVLRFYPSNTRVKIKFEDYIALHRILTNVSSYDIWENLIKFDKLPETMLKDVPDEFYGWVRKTEAAIRANYKTQFNLHLAHVSSIERYGGLSAKDFALRLLQVEGINHGVAFDLYNGKNPADKIWKMVKPAYEKPFNTEVG